MPQKPHSKMRGYLVRALYEVAHPLGYEVWEQARADPAGLSALLRSESWSD